MTTPEIVGKFQRLDRAIGTVCEFIGIDKRSMSNADQKALDDALKELDAASTELQELCYQIGGVK